jgi:tyrosine-protein phosphatase SIW14
MRYILLLTMAFLLTACATESHTTGGIPIANFHQVEDGIYRGAQPDHDGILYLKSIGIQTIIDLNDDDELMQKEWKEAKSVGITVMLSPLSGFFAPDAFDEETVQVILSQSDFRPVYIHCELGKDRTGLAVALYRVWHDHWSLQAAHDEWMAYGHSRLLFLMDLYFWRHAHWRPGDGSTN